MNFWDVGTQGWEGWAANVDRMNLKRRKAFYGDWWDEAAQWRSGGFDRLCGGAPGSPTTQDLAARGVKGTLFVHEILTVRPGSALDFLDAVVADARIVEWERRSAEFVTGGDTHLMTPLPKTVYGPDDWEDASLEDWLQPRAGA